MTNRDNGWCRFAGADLEESYRPGMSDVGKEVADIIGEWQRGIYHIRTNKVDWTNPRFIKINVDTAAGLSTWDGNGLTRLVFLCHDRGYRLDIEPCNMRYLTLWFHPRRSRVGSTYERHPTIEEALETHRKAYPDAVKVFETNLIAATVK